MISSITYQQTSIYFQKIGRGPTVVFLHGFTENLSIWNKYAQYLSSHYEVITIDLPGHGQSGVISGVHEMTLMADVVHAVLCHNNVKEAILIGHSMGGYVSLVFAERYSDMLKGIGLFHSTSLPDSDEKKAQRLISIEVVKHNKTSYINGLTPGLFSKTSLDKFPYQVQWIKDMGNNTSVEGICAALLGMSARKDYTSVLEEAEYPILFIIGNEDIIIPVEKLRPLVSIPKRSSACFLDQVGHMGYIEAESTCLQLIESFVESIYK